MLRKRKNVFIISLLFLVMSLFVLVNDVEAAEDNPYVKAYLDFEEDSEKKNKIKGIKSSEVEDLVDPEVENEIIIDTLKDYYNMDLLLLNELKSYSISVSLQEDILSTKREDKENAMHELIKMYYDISDISHKNIIIDFIERYVKGDINVDETAQDFLNEINNENSDNLEYPDVNDNYEDNLKSLNSSDTTGEEMKSGISTFAISMNNAGEWAYNNYNKYSKKYPKFTGKFGTDCTNFVSQALHVGGKVPYQGNWKISKLNNKYWVINSSSQLNASWKVSDPSPWISVKQFYKYWSKKSARQYSYSTAKYSTNHKKIYDNKIYKGSVVIFTKGAAGFVGVPTHAMIISSYDGGKKDFLLAGHSVERKAYPLTSAVKKYQMIDILVIK